MRLQPNNTIMKMAKHDLWMTSDVKQQARKGVNELNRDCMGDL